MNEGFDSSTSPEKAQRLIAKSQLAKDYYEWRISAERQLSTLEMLQRAIQDCMEAHEAVVGTDSIETIKVFIQSADDLKSVLESLKSLAGI